ncbi:hypothetical protein CU025_1211 [Enterococcus faecium]|nr:hypothetical protein M7W_1594 [Enterococcus faecium ATCC 8459 = NRRL B-2354]EFF23946.1 hypothetical protein EfmE1636_0955 [Enterococcus faecium E1636]EFF29008.1 hypothetical protein EfmU0317_1961 [Enterococcus faecium U0317]EFF31338.1 hypothetical protein EfmE1039_2022 [Enterococcus faecium E1039]EFF34121.1 hypothetical protein EfmE1162_2064 [Enterococcus faecium E1162]EHM34317.1 hypothetical protein EfmE4453_1722 [Enterococcus faecium E4453]MBK4749779.1 hypothetical protein [Enterococcus 
MTRREISKTVWFILKEKKLETTQSQAFFSIGRKFIHYF